MEFDSRFAREILHSVTYRTKPYKNHIISHQSNTLIGLIQKYFSFQVYSRLFIECWIYQLPICCKKHSSYADIKNVTARNLKKKFTWSLIFVNEIIVEMI